MYWLFQSTTKGHKTSYTHSTEKNQIVVTLSSGNFAINVK